jgi:Protein of unknown function (DUF3788)
MTPNAFIGKTGKPTQEEITKALGSSAETCKEFVDWLAQEQGVALKEWKSISPKYGWFLRLKLKKRTIVHLSPCDGRFRVAFILGDRAVKAAHQNDLPKPVLKLIHDAPHYVEGTGVRLEVKKPGDLAAIRKLAFIKLAN